MLPSLAVLEKIAWKIKNIPNRRKESKRGVHFCCYLLCSKAGLRVSEAVKFDLANKTRSGLYRIEKPKGKKERLVYIPKKVVRELKKHSWKPNQTNRWNFYHFLRKIKRELNISREIELSPHTLRRAFTTYHAEVGFYHYHFYRNYWDIPLLELPLYTDGIFTKSQITILEISWRARSD